MKYDFTTVIDRHGKDSIAVDLPENYRNKVHMREGFDLIPMWVADMNFAAAPSVTEAVIERAKHPTYGYFEPSEEYFSGIIRWQETEHGVSGLTKECIGYQNGVLGGVLSALRVLASPGEEILVHLPTYAGFINALTNHGFRLLQSALAMDADGIWRMDFADMEEKIRSHKIHTAIFCSPHNPCGRVWEKWEIEKAMELFRKYDVYVISDEIWSDLVLPGNKHIPTQSVSEDARNRTIAFYAPSKTFNLAGLVGSYHIIYNRWLRERVEKEASVSHYNNMNVLSMHALCGGYSETGKEWVKELCQVLEQNVSYACQFIRENFPGVEVAKPQGTYMLFLDCTRWCQEHGKTIDELLNAGYEVGVIWQDGREFHSPCAIRMNLALPFTRVQEAFQRLKHYVF